MNFPSSLLTQFCADLHIPYLDDSHAPFQTFDGSHLDINEGKRYAEHLINVLHSLRNW